MEGTPQLNHRLIESLIELENAAAEQFWVSEDRSAWKEELLSFAESKKPLQLKPYLNESADHPAGHPLLANVTFLDGELMRIFGNPIKQSTLNPNEDNFSIEKQYPENERVSGLFLGPGFWMGEQLHSLEQNLRSHLEWARQQGHLVFRSGFFNSSADILMAAELGFSGVQIHVHSLDLYELQMALELARDCKLCPIVSAATTKELELAIQTDAPHLGLCFFPGQNGHEHIQFVQQAITQIPKDCTRVLLGAIKNESELSYLSHLPFDCIFQFGAKQV